MNMGLTGAKLSAALLAGCLALAAQPALATTVTNTLYGAITNQIGIVSNVSNGDNAPGVTGGLLSATQAKPFTVTFTTPSPYTLGTDQSSSLGSTLFSVNPQTHMKTTGCPSHCTYTNTGTETVDINLTISFYNGAGGALLGSISDSALAKFIYTGAGLGTDNLCWSNGSTTGPLAGVPGPSGFSASSGFQIGSHSATGSCNAPNAGNSGNGYETIYFSTGANNIFALILNDWSDWNETPQVYFQEVCSYKCFPNTTDFPTPSPEPITLSVFGAGLAGAVALRRRRKGADKL
jgi:hypothetical protein